MDNKIEKAVSDWNEHYKKTKAWLKKKAIKGQHDYESDVVEILFRAFDKTEDISRFNMALFKSERELLIKRCQRNLAILSEGIN